MAGNEALAVEARGLVKSFGARRAVDGVDVVIRKGELHSLLGPNGAGKTTIIRMLSGLARPDEGSVSVMGRAWEEGPAEYKRGLAVSPQETAVAPRLTVRENIELVGGVYGLPRAVVRDRTRALLGELGLEGRAGEQARALSGGTQRKLSIAMALVPDPSVVFLDEPTVGLDPAARKDLWRLIASLKGRTTVVLTTHYLEEADELSDRVTILKAGRVVTTGTQAELKRIALGVKPLFVKARELSPESVEALRAAYGDVRLVDGGAELRSERADFAGVVELLRSRGQAIEGASFVEPTLDDVFFSIVDKEKTV